MTIQEYTQRLLAHSGITPLSIEVTEAEEDLFLQINVADEDVGIVIGYHGENLAAIQRMIRIVFKNETTKRLVVNVNDYREKRQEKLSEMVTNIGQRVLETQRQYVFPYLPANERFYIHTFVAENESFSGLETVSEGEGIDRRLVIRIKE